MPERSELESWNITDIKENNIINDSVSTCDKTLDADAKAKSYDEETKSIPTNFNSTKIACKTQNFHVLLNFY